MRLQNKVVIVTGSTTGIGKAIALRCVAEGAKVVIHGLERDLGEAVMAQLSNDNAVLHIEDITNTGAADRLVDIAVKTFGKLDAVVNNAAAVLSSNIETTDTAFLRRSITHQPRCAVCNDQGRTSVSFKNKRLCAEYRFGECL